MGLMDALRRAEEQGKNAARHTYEKAREGWGDAESRLRRKMRILPRGANKRRNAPVSRGGMTAGLHDMAPQQPIEEREKAAPRPIVSVDGRDVEKPAASYERGSDDEQDA